jgi:hypothetical protein
VVGLLDGGLASVFNTAFGGIYLSATLHRPVNDDDDGAGGGSGTGFGPGEPVRAQLDATTQAMQSADGYVDTDQRIIVLAHGIDPITTDCEITVGGRRWSIASVTQDPAKAYYDLHGRLASVPEES